jgi:hypothetical protein
MEGNMDSIFDSDEDVGIVKRIIGWIVVGGCVAAMAAQAFWWIYLLVMIIVG